MMNMCSEDHVPVLETERLLLRGHRLDDLDQCALMWANAEVTRFIGGRPHSREQVWARLLRYAGHWSMLGYGYWVIQDKHSGQYLGELGFADLKREMVPSLEGLPEIGWALAAHVHGKGYGTEAVRAAVAWGDAYFTSVQQTVCLIHPENVPSIRLAQKNGYREYRRTLYAGTPALLFVRECR